MVGISHCGEGIIMTHRYKIDIKWITFDEVIPKWGKTPRYQADKLQLAINRIYAMIWDNFSPYLMQSELIHTLER